MTPPVRIVAALAALLVVALAPATAEGRRALPQGLLRVNFDRAIAIASPPDLMAAQFPKLAQSGVENVRPDVYWSIAQPEKNGPVALSFSDNLMAMAAKHNLRVLPVVINAPEWARMIPAKVFSPPKDPSAMRKYLRALVD